MTDNLRDRIAAAITGIRIQRDGDSYRMADAVIAELGKRRCERCRHPKPLTDFPDPQEGSDEMRPFCTTCTGYVEWATS